FTRFRRHYQIPADQGERGGVAGLHERSLDRSDHRSIGIFATSRLRRLEASQASYAACILSHRSGPLPQSWPRRTAISAVIAVSPAITRCRVWRLTPSRVAISPIVR